MSGRALLVLTCVGVNAGSVNGVFHSLKPPPLRPPAASCATAGGV
jgi:hypothetical protein